MGTSLDALNASSSLTQRRQAASHLPTFELPPPTNLQFASVSKVPPLSGLNITHGAPGAVSVGNLLTPPSNSASEASAASSIPGGTTPNNSGVPVLPYTPTFFNTGTTPNGYHTGYTPQQWPNSNPLFPPRSMFSPMPGPAMRHHTNSPTAGEGSALPPPPYDLSTGTPFGASLSLSSPTSGTGPSGHQHVLANPLMSNGIRPPSQHSPLTPIDVTKSSSTPALFTSMASSTPQQSGYSYATSTTVSQSPHTHPAISSIAAASRLSPPIPGGGLSQSQSQSPFMRPPPPSYSLPAMPGPIMTNMHSPGAQMSMVGNIQAGMLPLTFNSGYAANPQALYGQQRTSTPQQPSNNDRPFKCDQCPQSFNRNHDLKRHKRIHLAVKPFPCNHCDKSFSRKDALKVGDPRFTLNLPS